MGFTALKLAQFNANPSQRHHDAADRTIQYLYHTRNRAICYGQGGQKPLICASDASFADNLLDRKSSQGYVVLLFGGPIAWRANKQDTVTTLSTEAELLALTQTAKEAIWLGRLFRALLLELDDPLAIQCDNRQTIRLVSEESAKLQTKLRHVDIHNHWLRQEHTAGRVRTEWVETGKMVADGMTKSLPKGKFEGPPSAPPRRVQRRWRSRRGGISRRADRLQDARHARGALPHYHDGRKPDRQS